MNAIRATRALNQRELDAAVPPSASWHADYRDTAYVYIGGLPLDLSEGDVVTIFSQFGNPTHLNLVREKETGKSRGFAFLKYEDQRSCDLAVDNLGGSEVLGRVLRVDHSRYKKREGEDEDTWRIERLEGEREGEETEREDGEGRRGKKRKVVLREERELEKMIENKRDGEDEDPMREYLIREKREEVEKAREKEREREKRHGRKHRHRRDREDVEDGHGREHGSRKHRRGDEGDEDGDRDSRRQRHRDKGVGADEKQRGTRRNSDPRDAGRRREDNSHTNRDGRDDKVGNSRQRRRSSSPDGRVRRRRDRDRSQDDDTERSTKYRRREHASSDDERRQPSQRDGDRRRRGTDE